MSTYPLEGNWIHRSLSIVVDGHSVTADARAHWGGVEITLTAPVTGLTRGWDGRCWAFALLASHRPEERYALRGQITAKGLKAGETMMAELYQDWREVRSHEAEVDAACRRARRELADLDRMTAARKAPLREARLALRQAFKAGTLSQLDHQRQRKELNAEEARIDSERHSASETVQFRFLVWIEEQCGRQLSLIEAERLLCEGAVVVDAA